MTAEITETSEESNPIEVDPVCGVELHRNDARATATWETLTFYFCGEACQQRFLLDPSRYCVSCVETK